MSNRSPEPPKKSRLGLNIRDNYDHLFLILLFVADIVLRIIWLDKPAGWLILDEHYYVNAARVVLGQPSTFKNYFGNAPLGRDPIMSHPPLAVLMIALSISLFGDNGFGWRFLSVCFGSAAVLIFYLLLRKVANRKVALIGTFLFSFDNLIFIQSRVAMLDIFTLAFMLLGFYLYFSGRLYLSAAVVALSTLTKLTGAAGFLVVVIVEVARFLRSRGTNNRSAELVKWLGKYTVGYLSSFFLSLAVLDYFWGSPTNYSAPFIRLQSLGPYCPDGLLGSCPWQWIMNQIPIISTLGNGIQMTFAMNPAILVFAIPALAYCGYSYLRKNSIIGLFSVVWFAVTYLPFYPPAIFSHTFMYIFYFLLTMPSVCGAVAYVIVDRRLPWPLILFYFIIVLFFFSVTFPFKTVPYF